MLRQLIAALSLATILLSTPAHAATTAEDGSWWTKLTKDSKEIVVAIMLDAFAAGMGTGIVYLAESAGSPEIRDMALSGTLPLPTFSKTNETYAAAIDAFYNRYPDALAYPTSHVLPCLFDQPPASCDDLVKEWRRATKRSAPEHKAR